MKTFFRVHFVTICIVFQITFCLVFANNSFSQSYFQIAKMNNVASELFQYESPFGKLLGIRYDGSNPYLPQARLHIKDIVGERPVLQLDQTGVNGIIKFLFTDGEQNYGIYQSGPTSGKVLMNYFQDPIKIGSPDGFGTKYHQTGINTIGREYTFSFQVSPSSLLYTPLRIVDTMVIVSPLLVTNQLQILDGAGENMILLSDNVGHARWANPKTFDDQKWSINADQDMYANPSRKQIGIGFQNSTDKIYQRLHILDGNILISKSNSGSIIEKSGQLAPGSTNGSLMFGTVVNDLCPQGDWAIEYRTVGTDYQTWGLNIWKPWTSYNPGGEFYFYINNQGNVGINTGTPEDKFQVNSGVTKLAIGSAEGASLGWGTSYIGFNASRQTDKWTFSSDLAHNGGAIIFSDIFGNLRFITAPYEEGSTGPQVLSDSIVKGLTKMVITKDGSLCIGTDNPFGYKLAVNGKVICTELKVQLLEEWGDYVFEPDYQVMPLTELKKFIAENKRLPETPSADEVKNNGISVGEMNTLLMKKVEELTLYILDLQQQIDSLKSKMNQ